MSKKYLNEQWTGKKFDKILAISEIYKIDNVPYFDGQCDCGSVKKYRLYLFTNNKYKSKMCGDCNKNRTSVMNKKHGLVRKDNPHWYLYQLWASIKGRCLRKSCKDYPYYGARGIKIHDEWIDFPEKFVNYILESIGERPNNLFSIDRMDNNKGYVPGNLSWSSKKNQTKNRRKQIKNSNYNSIENDLKSEVFALQTKIAELKIENEKLKIKL